MNANYVHFQLPRIKKEIVSNPIPEKYIYNDLVLDKLGQSY